MIYHDGRTVGAMTEEGERMADDVAQLAAEFPGWYLWQGPAGMCYARRRIDLANVTVRAHNWTALLGRIKATEQRRQR